MSGTSGTAGRALRALRQSRTARLAVLSERVTVLEAALAECREVNLRLAEIMDVVEETLTRVGVAMPEVARDAGLGLRAGMGRGVEETGSVAQTPVEQTPVEQGAK